MMTPPFQRLAVLAPNGIICAARGPQLLTFAKDGQALSSWTHPAAQPGPEAAGSDETAGTNANGDVEMSEDGPPAKKRKREGADPATAPGSEVKVDTPASEQAANSKGQRKQRAPTVRQENQFIINLIATKSGSHVVAVSGQDKALWVFAHDGSGGLTELSQRIMPKRPSSIDMADDERTIVCADKFGDVYGLPLEPGDSPEVEVEADPETSSTSNTSTQGKLRAASKKGANELTVHSKRNLRALEEQRRHQEKMRDKPKDGPEFEHSLLLGHVSMLTTILAMKVDNRPYLLTADRDEHIRISRGIPQSHIIDGFCLGHTSFVNALCIPNARQDILISGGGDKELFVWRWLDYQLLSKVDLLPRVQEVVPDVSQVAVSQLVSYTSAGSEDTFVLAICEKIPAVFVFSLEKAGLKHAQTIKTPANPLDTVVIRYEDGVSMLVVGCDQSDDGPSLVHYELDSATNIWAQQPRYIFDESACKAGSGPEVSREELDNLLYTVENLRKTDMEEIGEEDNAPIASSKPDDSRSTAPALEAA